MSRELVLNVGLPKTVMVGKLLPKMKGAASNAMLAEQLQTDLAERGYC